MKRFLSAILALTMILGLCACGPKTEGAAGMDSVSSSADQSAEVLTWEEQYDLGVKYLTDGNYREAIIAFTAAIEIDPKRVETYTALARAYIAQGDMDGLRATLERGYEETENAGLKERLDRLDQGEVLDDEGNVVRRNYYNMDGSLAEYQVLYTDPERGVERSDNYGGDGVLTDYTLYYASEDGLRSYSEQFGPDGTFLGKSVSVDDKNGNWLYSAGLDQHDRELTRSVAQYDDQGACIGWDNLDEDGLLTGYARFADGTTVYYDADGTPTMYRP